MLCVCYQRALEDRITIDNPSRGVRPSGRADGRFAPYRCVFACNLVVGRYYLCVSECGWQYTYVGLSVFAGYKLENALKSSERGVAMYCPQGVRGRLRLRGCSVHPARTQAI
jgi:hypothetical protein